MFRQGLAGLVEDADDLVLVSAVRSIPHPDDELAVGDARPDVVLLDLQLAGEGRRGWTRWAISVGGA